MATWSILRGTTDREDAIQDERTTVAGAAERLGISKEAVRKRITRGSLRSDKDTDGAVRVYVPASGTSSEGESNALTSQMRSEIDHLRGQLEAERQAHAEARRIIAGLVERIPAIEAPTDERDAAETVEQEPEGAQPRFAAGGPQTSTQPPWWRRILR